jgi:hypothetical protein
MPTPYGAGEDAAQTATRGLLAAVGTTPHDTAFSLRNVAGWRVIPQ